MEDIFGRALLDYYHGDSSAEIITETNISDQEVLPVSYLFRNFEEMPELEQKALELCHGNVLDVGCGAGSHSLYLQNKSLEVTAIDISKGATEVASSRGVKNVQQKGLLDISNEKFDTILLLMNGSGIFESVEKTPQYLNHLKSLLNPDGQILIDSSDLQYMYDRNEDGSIWVPVAHYYGELDFVISYKGKSTEPFPWLYIHDSLLKSLVEESGLQLEIVARGEHYDYLARISF